MTAEILAHLGKGPWWDAPRRRGTVLVEALQVCYGRINKSYLASRGITQLAVGNEGGLVGTGSAKVEDYFGERGEGGTRRV
jgi:hypothetical protein